MATETTTKVYVPRTRMEREALAQLAYHTGKVYGVVVTRFGSYGPGEGARYEARIETEDEFFYGHAWWESHDHEPILRVRIHTGGQGQHVILTDVETVRSEVRAFVRDWKRKHPVEAD